jgi:hypothetical protein
MSATLRRGVALLGSDINKVAKVGVIHKRMSTGRFWLFSHCRLRFNFSSKLQQPQVCLRLKVQNQASEQFKGGQSAVIPSSMAHPLRG